MPGKMSYNLGEVKEKVKVNIVNWPVMAGDPGFQTLHRQPWG